MTYSPPGSSVEYCTVTFWKRAHKRSHLCVDSFAFCAEIANKLDLFDFNNYLQNNGQLYSNVAFQETFGGLITVCANSTRCLHIWFILESGKV